MSAGMLAPCSSLYLNAAAMSPSSQNSRPFLSASSGDNADPSVSKSCWLSSHECSFVSVCFAISLIGLPTLPWIQFGPLQKHQSLPGLEQCS